MIQNYGDKEREINKSVFFTHCFSCLWLDGAECAHRYAKKQCVKCAFIYFTFLKRLFLVFSYIYAARGRLMWC